MAPTKCSLSISGGECLVLAHGADVLRALFLFLEHFGVLRTLRGRTIGMPGRSVPVQVRDAEGRDSGFRVALWISLVDRGPPSGVVTTPCGESVGIRGHCTVLGLGSRAEDVSGDRGPRGPKTVRCQTVRGGLVGFGGHRTVCHRTVSGLQSGTNSWPKPASFFAFLVAARRQSSGGSEAQRHK